MRISYLLRNLPEGLILRQTLHEPDADVAEIIFWPAEQVEPDVLYLSREPVADCPDNFACYSTVCAKNSIVLAPDASLEDVAEQMRKVLLADRRTVVRVQKTLRSFLNGRGLAAFVEEAARIFRNPLFVIDTSFHYIASALGDTPDNSILSQMVQESRIPQSGIRYIQDHALDRQLADGQVLEHFNEDLGFPTLVCSLRVHSIEVGHLMMVASARPVEPGDFTGIQMLSKMIALELQTGETFQRNNSASSYFLVDLLNDLHPTPERITQRLQHLPFVPQEELYLVVVDAAKHDLKPQYLRALEYQLGNLFSGALHAQYEEQIVLLFTQSPDTPTLDDSLHQLQLTAQRDSLVVGVSNPFSDLTTLRRFYQQARRAIALGQIFPKPNPHKPVFVYQDYSFIDMLQLCEQSGNLLDFCHPALLRLLRHDQKNHTDLMNTLYEYLRCGCSTQRAAKALFIHKNTLLYRMEHIREILGNDLSDPWDQLLFSFSFRILFHLNLYRSTRLERAFSEEEST